ncbi:MAG: sensor histidine kinase, partial [Chitinophagaceae bacterium]
FFIYGLVGMLITHIFRIILKRTRFFLQKNTIKLWTWAFISTLIISFIISITTFIPAGIKDFNNLITNVTVIEIVGIIVNWARYVSVWVIIYFMYKILEQKNILENEKLRIENNAKTTELELLKLQLNPHFLFNSLNTIKALVNVNQELSKDAIVKLSELLRFTLQYGKELLIPLGDELQEVKKYVDLEQLRYGNRLVFNCFVPDYVLNKTIPPALLLTLVENAVKHGVAKQANGGIINLETCISQNFLEIIVTNSGKYLPTNNHGIGLLHVQKRLEEVYQGKASFFICEQNHLVKSVIKIPI